MPSTRRGVCCGSALSTLAQFSLSFFSAYSFSLFSTYIPQFLLFSPLPASLLAYKEERSVLWSFLHLSLILLVFLICHLSFILFVFLICSFTLFFSTNILQFQLILPPSCFFFACFQRGSVLWSSSLHP